MSKPIISVEEAREIIGETAQYMSDQQIEDMVVLLDIIAKEALKTSKNKRSYSQNTDIA